MDSGIEAAVWALQRHPHVSALAPADIPRVKAYADGSYGGAWTYLAQAAHMEGAGLPYGLKYEDGERFAALAAFARPADPERRVHAHVIHPMGAWEPGQLAALARFATEAAGAPAYLKKIPKEQLERLRPYGFEDAAMLPWHPAAPLEDDTFPEVILDLGALAAAVSGPARNDNEIARKYQGFQRRFAGTARFEPFDRARLSDAAAVVERFFSPEYRRPAGLSCAADYRNMLALPELDGLDAFADVVLVGDEPVGFFVAERLAPAEAGVYANLVLYRNCARLSEYALTGFLLRMREHGVARANLGGSETAGLDTFKQKFARIAAGGRCESTWAVFGAR